MDLTYDWIAGLSTVILIIGIVAIGQFLIFRIPSIAQTREINNAMNKEKWRNKAKKYHHRVKSSQRIGLTVNLAFFVGIMPCLVTLEPHSWYRIALDVFLRQ